VSSCHTSRVMYFPVNVCRSCKKILRERERMYSHGMCQHCGWYPRASPVCDTIMQTWRQIELRPWWKFWAGKRYRYEQVD